MSEEIQDAAVVPVEQSRALAPAHRPMLTKQAIKDETEQRKLIGEYITTNMVEGIDGDFGVIPGTKKKTLLKPGAEKLIQLFYCTPRYTITSKTENYDTGLFSYQFKCEILNQDDYVVAQGVGFCSTYESKYRWIGLNRKCPQCGNDTIIKGKVEYGGGWLCWEKKNGCGAKFTDNDPAITSQELGQEQDPDIVNKVNTVLKIGKKRALVDAAISLARCSDLFTQDMDDMAPENNSATPVKPREKAKPNMDISRAEEMQNQQKEREGHKEPAKEENKFQKFVCPKCGVEAVGKSMYPPRNNQNAPPGWHCYEKSGGCKANFPHDDKAFVITQTEPPKGKLSDAEQKMVNEIIDGWRFWAENIKDVATFQAGFEDALQDKQGLAGLTSLGKAAVWPVIKGLAADKGWKWDVSAGGKDTTGKDIGRFVAQ